MSTLMASFPEVLANVMQIEESNQISDQILERRFSQNWDGSSSLHNNGVFCFDLPEKWTSMSIDITHDILHENAIKKAIKYLIVCNIPLPSAHDVLSFLHLHQNHIDTSSLRDYLVGIIVMKAWIPGFCTINLLRNSLTFSCDVHSLIGHDIHMAGCRLRHFLVNCSFHLPGEVQRTDHFISTFEQCFWEDNAGDVISCPIHYHATVCVVVFCNNFA